MCLMSYANNKGADQPAHPLSLISAFVVGCLDSIIRGLFGKFVEFGHNVFKYRYKPLIFFSMPQIYINGLASRS